MPRFLRNLAAAVLASGLACGTSCWAQQTSNTNLPLVWVLSTGGTIAGAGASPTNVQEYKGGTILGEDLVRAVPEIKQFANVKVQQITNVGSPASSSKTCSRLLTASMAFSQTTRALPGSWSPTVRAPWRRLLIF
jgi:L-asparaginase/Glu-tRNA(Gln) amidotransferase subunit D